MEAKIKMGTCPVCNGTGAVPMTDKELVWAKSWALNIDGVNRACANCGGQTMSCCGTGRVLLRPDGTPCQHEYEHELLGNCYHGYTCKHCGDIYAIDSGD